MWPRHQPHSRPARRPGFHYGARAIRAAVIHHDDLAGEGLLAKIGVQARKALRQASRLIIRRNHNGKFRPDYAPTHASSLHNGMTRQSAPTRFVAPAPSQTP